MHFPLAVLVSYSGNRNMNMAALFDAANDISLWIQGMTRVTTHPRPFSEGKIDWHGDR